MTAWFLLSLVTWSVVAVHASGGAHPRIAIAAWVAGWAFSAFFAWRVTRGGRISRMLLILAALGGVIALVIVLAITFRLAELGLLAATAAQLALLLSPAVYQRTRPGSQPGRWVTLSRRRAPAPLVAGLAAGVAIGLAGTAVCAAVLFGTGVSVNDGVVVRIQPGQHLTAALSPGPYGAFGGCGGVWGCAASDRGSLSVRGTLSAGAGLVADGPHDYQWTFAGQRLDSVTFTVPVPESMRFALSSDTALPVVITQTQHNTDTIRGWFVAAAAFGLLLLGSLAGLAWPVRRGAGGRW